MWTAIETALIAVILFSLPDVIKAGDTAGFILHIICRALAVIFDFGGLIFSTPFGVATGNMWDKTTIIITAALGVFATAVHIIKLLRYKNG